MKFNKMMCAWLSGITLLLLASCTGGTEGKVVDAYEEAQSQMKNASSNDEIDEINDKLIENIATILRENPEDISKVRTSADVKEAYKNYWNVVKKTGNGDSHWMFIPMPTISNLEKAL